jgi:replicative DNA helicase
MNAAMKADSFIVEVEQEVLGSLLMSGDVRRVRSFLEPRHFVEPLHQILYGYMLQAFDRFSSTSRGRASK